VRGLCSPAREEGKKCELESTLGVREDRGKLVKMLVAGCGPCGIEKMVSPDIEATLLEYVGKENRGGRLFVNPNAEK